MDVVSSSGDYSCGEMTNRITHQPRCSIVLAGYKLKVFPRCVGNDYIGCKSFSTHCCFCTDVWDGGFSPYKCAQLSGRHKELGIGQNLVIETVSLV